MKKRLIDIKGIDIQKVRVSLDSLYIVEPYENNTFKLTNDIGFPVVLAMDRFEDSGLEFTTGPGVKKDNHYDNSNGSLYLFAEQHQLNAWEFEIIKRIVRCRKKGEFISDIEKTKRVLDIYLKEQGHLFENQIEKLNK
jgi:hypothetical protein